MAADPWIDWGPNVAVRQWRHQQAAQRWQQMAQDHRADEKAWADYYRQNPTMQPLLAAGPAQAGWDAAHAADLDDPHQRQDADDAMDQPGLITAYDTDTGEKIWLRNPYLPTDADLSGTSIAGRLSGSIERTRGRRVSYRNAATVGRQIDQYQAVDRDQRHGSGHGLDVPNPSAQLER